MMPWIILTIIGMVFMVINVFQLLIAGAIVYALVYIGWVCLEVYLFIVVWSYRF